MFLDAGSIHFLMNSTYSVYINTKHITPDSGPIEDFGLEVSLDMSKVLRSWEIFNPWWCQTIPLQKPVAGSFIPYSLSASPFSPFATQNRAGCGFWVSSLWSEHLEQSAVLHVDTGFSIQDPETLSVVAFGSWYFKNHRSHMPLIHFFGAERWAFQRWVLLPWHHWHAILTPTNNWACWSFPTCTLVALLRLCFACLWDGHQQVAYLATGLTKNLQVVGRHILSGSRFFGGKPKEPLTSECLMYEVWWSSIFFWDAIAYEIRIPPQ